jgi:hypothetical protein
MDKSRILGIVFVFVLFATLIYAQDEIEDEIDYETFDFSTITTREDAERIDAAQAIEAGRGKELTTFIIMENFDEIEDLNDVDFDQAKVAIYHEYGINIDSFGKGAAITENMLTSTSGMKDFLNIDEISHQEVELTIDEQGRIIIKEAKKLPMAGSYSAVFNDTTEVDLLGLRKADVKGTISYRDDTLYVELGETAEIDSYRISAEKDPRYEGEEFFELIHRTHILFEPPEEILPNYVVISDDKLLVNADAGKVNVEPLPANKLFNMVQRKYDETGAYTLVSDDQDFMSISVQNGQLEAVSRADQGKTPEIRVSGLGGEVRIDTGRLSFKVVDELKLIQTSAGKERDTFMRNSAAFDLVSENFDERLRVTSSSRYSLLNQEGDEIAGTDAGLIVSDDVEFNMIKTVDDLRQRFPDVNFAYDEFDETANAVQVLDQWLEGKQGIEDYVSTFRFTFGKSSYARPSGSGKTAIELDERSLDPSYRLRNPIRETKSPLDTIDHEFGHVLDHAVAYREEEKSGIVRKRDTLFGHYRDYAEELDKELRSSDEYDKLMEKAFPERAERRLGVFSAYDKLAAPGLARSAKDENNAEDISQLVRAETGLFPYSFKIYEDVEVPTTEMSTTYSELPVEEAREHPTLAQLELDRVYSLDPPAPDWLVEQTEERYYSIMGEDYCRNNPCGPCLEYTLTCSKTRGVVAEAEIEAEAEIAEGIEAGVK